MILDPKRHRLSFGVKEWLAVAGLLVAPIGYVWNLSGRVLLLENTLIENTAILRRLDEARVQAAADRGSMLQQMTDFERRVSGVERDVSRRHGSN